MKIIVIVRGPGKLTPDFSLNFEVPALPRIGDYLSIRRIDQREPFGEDAIVRAVWWRLQHPETHGHQSTQKAGSLTEIFVESEPALSPYSSRAWKNSLELAPPGTVPTLAVARRLPSGPDP